MYVKDDSTILTEPQMILWQNGELLTRWFELQLIRIIFKCKIMHPHFVKVLYRKKCSQSGYHDKLPRVGVQPYLWVLVLYLHFCVWDRLFSLLISLGFGINQVSFACLEPGWPLRNFHLTNGDEYFLFY